VPQIRPLADIVHSKILYLLTHLLAYLLAFYVNEFKVGFCLEWFKLAITVCRLIHKLKTCSVISGGNREKKPVSTVAV